MVYSVRLYKNTGLAVNNSLDDYSLLDILFVGQFIDVPDVALKQDRGIFNIKVSLNWNDAKDIDYCKINNSCYWILDITMINDNVASINIMYDAITSIGIDNIEIIDGWCKRRTLSVDEDLLYKNILDEPFIPTNREMSYGSQWMPNNSLEEKQVVLSTVDLSKTLEEINEAFICMAKETGELGPMACALPKLPELDIDTAYIMEDTDNIGIAMLNTATKIAGTCIFNLDNPNVRRAINYVYSISAQNTILDSYMLPNMYFEFNIDANGKVLSIKQTIKKYKSKVSDIINNNINNYYNKKVFSGQFIMIQVNSVGSGNSVSYRPEDILPPNGDINSIEYYIIPDARYNGVPTLAPTTFKQQANLAGLMYGSITGAEWQRAPFTTSKSGMTSQMISYNTGRYIKDFQQGLDIVNSVEGAYNNISNASMMSNVYNESNTAVHSMFSGITGILGSLANMALYQQQAKNNRQMMRVQESAREAHFINAQGLVSYFGNIFTETIWGLDASDMARFDLFLTAFGYSVNEQLNKSMLRNNPTFDYIQTDELTINGLFDNNTKQSIINSFNNGVRIWHKKPKKIEASDNHNVS